MWSDKLANNPWYWIWGYREWNERFWSSLWANSRSETTQIWRVSFSGDGDLSRSCDQDRVLRRPTCSLPMSCVMLNCRWCNCCWSMDRFDRDHVSIDESTTYKIDEFSGCVQMNRTGFRSLWDGRHWIVSTYLGGLSWSLSMGKSTPELDDGSTWTERICKQLLSLFMW